MSKEHYIFIIFAFIFLCGCSDDTVNKTNLADAIELSAIKAEIVSSTNSTRATASPYLEDNISRYVFEHNDKMVFTKIQRTDHALTDFKYRDVAFYCNESGAWQRDKSTGFAGEGSSEVSGPERIYWSDASSAHTFIGYSIPKDNHSFDWKKSSYCYDKDGSQYSYDTYYGAIGNPLNSEEVINYNKDNATKTETYTTIVNNKPVEKTFKYSQDLRNEDLLLTYDEELKADNSVANIKFYHALSSVRVIVNISGFYGTATDSFSVVSDMKLLDQPTMYRWKQNSRMAEPLLNENENNILKQETLWGNSAPSYNQRKDMILWNAEPEGAGHGSSKTFTFYGITVPQESDFFDSEANTNKDLQLKFKVTYPDPLKDDPVNHTISKWYYATIPAKKANNTNNHVYFHPGKCTTIKVTLNHKDESMTIGASYMDWEYIETPDEGNLKKKSTFLQAAPSDRTIAKVTIATDQGATEDDATWLYIQEKEDNTKTLLDIYGNDGTKNYPFTISTANQLLSFAYEVNNGRSFAGQYVKMDADITMQKGYDIPMTTNSSGDITGIDYSKLVNWIGIGEGDKVFNGIFLGSGRHINNLCGSPFFNKLGDLAVIDKVSFTNVIKVIGTGVVANINSGLICGCNVEGNVEQAQPSGTGDSYCGSFVGDNQSFIVACSHIGDVHGYGYIGGLVGRNAGAIVASYHAGNVEYAKDATSSQKKNIGGSTGYKDETKSVIYSCYQNRDLIAHKPDLLPCRAAWPLTTAQMQSDAFVNSDKQPLGGWTLDEPTSEQGSYTPYIEGAQYHYSLNRALQLFAVWVNEQANKNSEVVLPCHTFSKEQVQTLNALFSTPGTDGTRIPVHLFKYTPGTYPKVQ